MPGRGGPARPSGIRLDDRRSHVLKGVPGDGRLFAVASI
jgi:hypothetical protein